jgi:hypothetical protein
MTVPHYEERQRFAMWVYVLILVVMVAVEVSLFAAAHAGDSNSQRLFWPVTGVSAAVIVLTLNWLCLTTHVSDDRLHVRLGIILPIGWKRIPLDETIEIRSVKYRPLRDAGGWGIRLGRFEGSRCWFYNARGDRGVFIRTARRNYIIGSQFPEQLYDALTSGTSSGSPADSS